MSEQPDENLRAELSKDPDRYWKAAEGLPELSISPEAPSALEKLGPSPFPKSKFPFLGFLATVYDHVATHAKQRGNGVEATDEHR
jgi:hypothetical protein